MTDWETQFIGMCSKRCKVAWDKYAKKHATVAQALDNMGQLVYDYGPHNVNPGMFSEEKEKNEKLYFLAYPTDKENEFTTSIEKFKDVNNIIVGRMRENLSKKWCLSDTVKLILFDIKSQMERQDSMLHNPLTQEEKQRNKRFFKILGLSRTPKKDRKRKGEIASKGDGLKYIFSFTHQSKKSTLDHLGSEVFCHNKLLPGKGILGLQKQNDHEKYHTYRTYDSSSFGTQFTQQRHQDLMAGKEVLPLNNPLPYMTRTGARDPSARLLSRDKSNKESDSDDEISIPTPSGEIPDSKTVFHKPPKPPKSKYTSFKVGKKVFKEETAKLDEMSAKLRVDWVFLEAKLAEKSMQQHKAESALYKSRRLEIRKNMNDRIRKRFQSSFQQTIPISISSQRKKFKPPLQPSFLGGIPKDEFLKGLQKSLAKMPHDLSPYILKN